MTAREPVSARLRVVPPDDAYACTACGSCCRRPWTVGISAEEHARYRDLDWSAHAPGLAGVEPWTPLGSAWVLARDAAGACVFLEPDGRCLIHRVLGYAQKPQSCQAFPYNFIETPDGVRTSLSWATWGRRVGEAPAPGVVEAELEPAYVRDRAAHGTFEVRDRDTVGLVDLFRAFVTDGEVELTTDERLVRIVRVTELIVRGELSRGALADVRAALLAAPGIPVPPRRLRAGGARLVAGLLRGPLAGLLALPVVLASPVRTEGDALRLAASLGGDLLTRGFVPPHLARHGAPRIDVAVLGTVRFPPEAEPLWARFLSDVLLDGLMVSPDDLERWASWVLTLYGHARWLAKWAAARAGRSVASRDDVRWAMAEAPSSTGPHWGPAGRAVRRLGRAVVRLYRRPGVLAAYLSAAP